MTTSHQADTKYVKGQASSLPPDTVIGGYRVVRKLSAGGFGVVYLAVDNEGQQFAIKEYLPASLATRGVGELLPQVLPEKLSLYRLGLKSFFEEGRSLAQISHASVVSVLNFFRENETVYMVMNYLEGATLQDFIITARDLKKHKVFRESTIRSLFDEILRGLRIVHQHKMLHLDIKPANIFITDDNRAVMIDFGAAREVLTKEGNFIRPMYTPGFAAPEMYRRDSSMGPWTDIYAIGACIYACMQGYPPNDAPQRLEKDRLVLALSRLRGVYSDNLIEVVEWCMSLDPLSRPQSVFALQKELSRENERRYTKLTVGEKVRLQIDSMVSDTKKNVHAKPMPSATPVRNEVFGFSGQPQGRASQERRPHGLLLHARIGPVLAGRRHGRPSGGRGGGADGAADNFRPLPEEARPCVQDRPNSCPTRCWRPTTRSCAMPSQKGMLDTPRTTLVAAVLQGNGATWVHCGDSRLYVVREGELLMRTRDHSYRSSRSAGSTRLELRQPQHAVHLPGLADQAPCSILPVPFPLQQGDKILLCSDGLWDSLGDAEIVRTLAGKPVSEAVPELVEAASQAGGEHSDNVTVLAMEWETPDVFESTRRHLHRQHHGRRALPPPSRWACLTPSR